MNIQLARVYGVFLGIAGILGLFVHGHLFLIANSDAFMDMLRIVFAGILLYVSYGVISFRAVNTALMGVGVLYVGMALAGLLSSTLGGLLPSGLTGFDIAFHLVAGGTAIAVAGSHHHEDIAHQA